MIRLIGLTVFLLILVNSKSEQCKEDDLRACLTTLQKLLEDEYSFVKKTEDELNEYCLTVQKESICLKDATDICKDEHRLIAALSATLFNHLNQVCSPGRDWRKIYMSMLPCIEGHASDFEKCPMPKLTGKEDSQLDNVCLDMKSMLCVADASRKVCGKDGKAFAESLEFGIKDSYSEVCSGVGCFTSNYWIIFLSGYIGMLFRHKY